MMSVKSSARAVGAVAADIDGNLGRGFVLLKENAVGDVLEVGEGLALAADQTASVFRCDVHEDAVIQIVLFHRGREAQRAEDFFDDFFRLR